MKKQDITQMIQNYYDKKSCVEIGEAKELIGALLSEYEYAPFRGYASLVHDALYDGDGQPTIHNFPMRFMTRLMEDFREIGNEYDDIFLHFSPDCSGSLYYLEGYSSSNEVLLVSFENIDMG